MFVDRRTLLELLPTARHGEREGEFVGSVGPGYDAVAKRGHRISAVDHDDVGRAYTYTPRPNTSARKEEGSAL